MKELSLIVLITIISISIYSQEKLKQSIKGIIVDKQSQMPLPGATIVLLNFDPIIGTTTNEDGNFKLENIPIGRHDIQVTYMGYNPFVLNNLLLSSGKELVLKIELEESCINVEEIVIKAYSRKDQPINKNAMISARSFTVEETSRYAGSYGDPARMAANYAGVMTGRDNRNDIIIRGNSSMGILWRLDDIEIPNPSHYAALGTTGGPISILNNNLLTNSDFLTGAFPAEYGNALAGVFDLRMRTGNNEKKEYWLQTGWNGLEFGTEGPFSKKQKASYLFAYRYSLLDILNALGIKFGIDPKYQDLTFKINIPNKKGRITVSGIGGKSQINIFDENKSQEDWLFENSGENIANSSDIGMLAFSNLFFLNEKTRIKTNISVLGSVVSSKIDTLSISNPEPYTKAGENSSEIKYSFSTTIKKKFNVKNSGDIGIIYDIYNYYY
ncbi:MAG: TonB-dependent receptor, partial [Bacteroidetes bacterium]|nr:TonB-dependent receptor [Bacteroidota bacterium]